jgi:hypothetical protein
MGSTIAHFFYHKAFSKNQLIQLGTAQTLPNSGTVASWISQAGYRVSGAMPAASSHKAEKTEKPLSLE